jgi:hypothetical protein
MTHPIFRCPTDALDEIVPDRTLGEWVQGTLDL